MGSAITGDWYIIQRELTAGGCQCLIGCYFRRLQLVQLSKELVA